MNFAFICTDDGNKDAERAEHLIEHLRYVESVLDKMVVGGPCPGPQDDGAPEFQGSIMVYKADSEAEARALFEADPYVKNNIWAKVRVMPFVPVAGTMVGGKTWVIEDGAMKRAEPHGL